MKKNFLTMAALAILAAMPAWAQQRSRTMNSFASDAQTVPVMGNVVGAGGARFQTYVAILNPTANAYPVTATLYDAAGTPRTATINLAAGELKTYTNFLESVFGFTGGGAVTFRSAESTGGTHNNRFIVSAESFTAGTHYGTPIPSLEFAGSASRSFSAGISIDSSWRTNVGCFNQSEAANKVKATVYDASGKMALGSVEMNLPPNGWGQTGLTAVVSDGFVQFDPSEAAVCYAVVVNNASNDARFVPATEYAP
jgi:hypothetical protein